MIYTVDHFIQKFEPIPDDQWCIGALTGPMRDGIEPHCAMGHCGFGKGCAVGARREADALVILFHVNGLSVSGVNDFASLDERFNQPTPKQRILAALHYIKSEQT